MFAPVIIIQGLGGPVEVANNDYFACLDVTHSDWIFFLVRQLTQFQQIEDGGWWIMANKHFDGGGLPFCNEEFICVDFTFIGAD